MKKFSTHNEDRKKRMKEFQEILSTIDKDSIIKSFKMGLGVGLFGKRNAQDDLFLQFNEGGFVYTIARLPMKRFTFNKQNLIEKAIKND